MKLLAVALLAAVLSMVVGTDTSRVEDEKAVRRAVLDYVEAFYESKPELWKRGVHPELAKFGFWRAEGAAEYERLPFDYDQGLEFCATYNADGHVPADAPKDVAVLDLLDRIATVKLTAEWGIDYMHLARFEDEWKIVQVVWQSHPPKGE
jgi:hypothetical protein